MTIKFLLWTLAIVLTFIYWTEIRAASLYWQVVMIIGYIFLLVVPGSVADKRAEIDSEHRGIRTLISEKKYAEALRMAESALTNSPDHAQLLYAKGECLSNLGHEEQAEKAYLKVLELDSSHAFAANNLGSLYMNGGQYLKAAKYYRQAQKAGASGEWFDRNIERIWKNLINKSVELSKAGDLLKAVECFQSAKDFGAKGTIFDNNLQVLKDNLITKGKEIRYTNLELALEYANAILSLSLDQERAIAYAWKAALLSEAGRHAEALKDLEICIKLDPSYRPSSMEKFMRDIEAALAESQKLPPPAQPDNVLEKSSTTEKALWQVGQYAFKRFHIRKIILGGMGQIYCCWDIKNRMFLALKAVNLNKIVDPQRTSAKQISYRNLLRKEAENWRQLGSHPNIVHLYTVEDFEHRYLVLCMEYIAGHPSIGPTLQDHLRYKGKLSVKEAIQVGLGICDAMQFAYEKLQLVHRDLKPENIFLTETGTVKVGDFGLASTEGQHAIVAGTPYYVAPELPITTRTYKPEIANDIYATGIILYESLSGRLPIYDKKGTGSTKSKLNLNQWISKHRKVKPPSLTDNNQNIPDALVKIVMKCLAKRPAERFHSFESLREELVNYAKEAGLDLVKPKIKLPDADKHLELYNEAITLDSLGYYEEAITKYQKLVTIEPFQSKISIGWCNMGKVLVTLQRYDEALGCFEKAITINHYDTHALFGKANTLGLLGRHEESLKGVQALLSVDPAYTDAYGCKGYVFLHTGRIEEAESAYQKAVDMHPAGEHFAALNGLGLCARENRLFSEALDYFDRAIAAKSDYAEAYSNRCDILRMLGRIDEAIKSGHKAVDIDPSEAGYKISLAMAYGNAEDYSESASQFEEALELDPKIGFAWFGLATSYVELGRLNDAIQCARHATKLGYPDGQKLVDEIERQEYGES